MSEDNISLSRACRSEFESKCTCFDLTASERYGVMFFHEMPAAYFIPAPAITRRTGHWPYACGLERDERSLVALYYLEIRITSSNMMGE